MVGMTESPPTSGRDAQEAELHAWLNRGGYVLEMEVAAVCARQSPTYLEQGFRFSDPDTGKEREGDVIASFALEQSLATEHSLTLIFECKNTTAPWVGFVGRSAGLQAGWVGSRGYDWTCGECRRVELAVEELFPTSPRSYAITEKRSKNTVDHAWEGVQQAASALLAISPRDEAEASSHSPAGAMSDIRSLVVTRSPLYTCTLTPDGRPQLQEVPSMNVLVQRPTHIPMYLDGVVVHVMTLDWLRARLELIEAVDPHSLS